MGLELKIGRCEGPTDFINTVFADMRKRKSSITFMLICTGDGEADTYVNPTIHKDDIDTAVANGHIMADQIKTVWIGIQPKTKGH